MDYGLQAFREFARLTSVRIKPRFENQRAHDHNKNDPHKARAMLKRQACAQQAAQYVGKRHGQHKVPPNMALVRKQRNGR